MAPSSLHERTFYVKCVPSQVFISKIFCTTESDNLLHICTALYRYCKIKVNNNIITTTYPIYFTSVMRKKCKTKVKWIKNMNGRRYRH